MNRSEIRIGNWVHHKAVWSKYNNDSNASEPLTDFDMLIEQACFYHDEECTLSIENDLEPIPLTEEWLRRFSFAKFYDDDKIFYRYNDLPVRNVFELRQIHLFDLSEAFYFVAYDEADTGKPKEPMIQTIVETVHHLQNLFFALTGQELQAKEI